METEKMELKNFFHAVNVVLVIFLVGMVLFYYNQLPERIPVHFGADGTPNGWAGKGMMLILLIVALVLSGIFYIIMFAIPGLRKRPHLLSIPHKDRFLALPEEKQQVYWDLMKEYLACFAVTMNILWLTAIGGTLQVALGHVKRLPSWALWPGLILMLFVNIIYIPRLIRMPKKLVES